MKTAIVLASLAMALTTSCRKDYTCTCTATTGTLSSSATTTTKMWIWKKGAATTWCAGGNSTTDVNGVPSTTTCKLS